MESSPSLGECQESSQTLRELSSSPKAHGPHLAAAEEEEEAEAEEGEAEAEE